MNNAQCRRNYVIITEKVVIRSNKFHFMGFSKPRKLSKLIQSSKSNIMLKKTIVNF